MRWTQVASPCRVFARAGLLVPPLVRSIMEVVPGGQSVMGGYTESIEGMASPVRSHSIENPEQGSTLGLL